jgi:hypothetical protein
MNDARCAICGWVKETSVPFPLCHTHAVEMYRGLVVSASPAYRRRERYQARLALWAQHRDTQRSIARDLGKPQQGRI